jgi:hypothetical protein
MFEDMNFQRIVLMIAGMLLLGFLAVVAYSMIKANTIGEWPPVIANCPDSWVMDVYGKTCKNMNGVRMNAGTACTNTNFTDDQKYLGQSGLCEKYKWSQTCGVNWDGISNNPNVCTKKT